MRYKGLNKFHFAVFLVVLLVLFLTTSNLLAQERTWSDARGLVSVTVSEAGAFVSFDLDIWAELYDTQNMVGFDGELINFRAGPFAIVDLEGEIEDVCIGISEAYNWYGYEDMPVPAMFFLMEDGTVEYALADLYDAADWLLEWEPEFRSSGSLPFLQDIQSITWESTYEGVGEWAAIARDTQDQAFDLSHIVNLRYLTNGHWVTDLVEGEDLDTIRGHLFFYEDGTLDFEVGRLDDDYNWIESYESWSGTYTLVLAEGQQYAAGSLLVDLKLNWWIWEDEGDLGLQEYQAIYRLSGNPWWLTLHISEGRTFYPYPGNDEVYYFWNEPAFYHEHDGDEWDLDYAMDHLDYDDLEEVRAFLANGNEVDSRNDFYLTPLMLAVRDYNNPAVVKELLEAGADVNTIDFGGNTPLIWAAWAGNDLEILTLLIEAGADVNYVDDDGFPPLMWFLATVADFKLEAIQLFLEAGADLSFVSESGTTALMQAVQSSSEFEVLKFIIDHGVEINAQNDYGITALMYAVGNGASFTTIEWLIANGARADLLDSDGDSALHWIFYDFPPFSTSVVKLLLKHGADPNQRGHENSTPLSSALISEASDEIVLVLIEAGADVNQIVFDSYPFLTAILFDYGFDVIKAFIEAGADPFIEEESGATALMYAAMSLHGDSMKIVELLIEAGLNIDQRDAFGFMPLHFATSSNSSSAVVAVLLNAGAKVDARDIHGCTPLMLAARSNPNPEIIRLLLDAGANGKLKSEDGKTAFDYAQENEELIGTDEYWLLSDARFE